MSYVAPKSWRDFMCQGWRNGSMASGIVYVVNNRGSSNYQMGFPVIAGYTLVVTSVYLKMKTGTNVGTWTFAVGSRQTTFDDGSRVDTEIATNTGAENSWVIVSAEGTIEKPLATIIGAANRQAQIYVQSQSAPSSGATAADVVHLMSKFSLVPS